jgi:hypothetical protein
MMNILVDDSLKKLARKLRLLGFDTAVWSKSIDELASNERDIFLTKSRRFLEKALKMGIKSYLIKSDRWESQIRSVFQRLRVSFEDLRPFSRCTICNGSLEELAKDSITGEVPEYILFTAAQFHKCTLCGRIYWRGSHTVHLERLLEITKVSGDTAEKNTL